MATSKVIGKVVDYQALKNTLVGGPRYELVIETTDGEILRGKTRSSLFFTPFQMFMLKMFTMSGMNVTGCLKKAAGCLQGLITV